MGALPNAVMPATFMAHAYDLPDPWENAQAYDNHCARPDPTTHEYGASCSPWNASEWNPHVRREAPLVRNNSAPFFMGPIHPRFKRELGRRLARPPPRRIPGIPASRHTCSAHSFFLNTAFGRPRATQSLR